MKIEFNYEDLESIVKNHILPLLKNKTVFTLQGPLGAGKTTIVKEILRQLGVTEEVTSPTFTYVKNYTNASGKTFHHFDLYRIGSQEEFISSGFDEYLHAPDSYCFIEWPEIIFPLLDHAEIKKHVCKIVLSYDPNDLTKRQIELIK